MPGWLILYFLRLGWFTLYCDLNIISPWEWKKKKSSAQLCPCLPNAPKIRMLSRLVTLLRFQVDLVQNNIFFEHEHSSENNGESVIIHSMHLRVLRALIKYSFLFQLSVYTTNRRIIFLSQPHRHLCCWHGNLCLHLQIFFWTEWT